MNFISYAQNFEDVMLWRALKHIECGFYIDVGANDPVVDSVTKAFYERGWRGINIEPIFDWFTKLQEDRPRDINLQLAAGSINGELEIYELPDTGLSTIDKLTAQSHEAEHGFKNLKRTVPVARLTEICQRLHVAPIHFMKIDVEGAEKDVLLGIDFAVIRPWIILVESTLPLTQVEAHEDWEPILLNSGYEYVYFDGLNRYYIAQEHGELKTFFSTPPNIFDGFILSGLANQPFCKLVEEKSKLAETHAQQSEARAQHAETHAQQSEARAQQAETKVDELNRTAHHWWIQAEQLNLELKKFDTKIDELNRTAHNWFVQAEELKLELQNVYASRSWRITAPLRKFILIAKPILHFPLSVKSVSKKKIKHLLAHAKFYFNRRPRLKRFALVILAPFPSFKERLRYVIIAQQHTQQVLSPRARRIYTDINAAIKIQIAESHK